jgi:hypothetical protein
MRIISAMPTSKYGATLPSMRPTGSTGVTRSCSRVPCSRSLTMATVVRMVATIIRMIAMSPGMM